MRIIAKIILIFSLLLTAALPAVSSAYAPAELQRDTSAYTESRDDQTYVIKLNGEPEVLKSVATNLQQRFSFSDQPAFQNIYSFQSDLTLEQLRDELAGQFEYLDKDNTISLGATKNRILPDDPLFSRNRDNIDKQWGLIKAGFVDAWKKTKGSATVVVAVIDTGIDQTHEDFESTIFVPGYDVINKRPLARTRRSNFDDNGHGTLISGVIGATSNNRQGMAGALWEVSLMPIKALNARGSGTSSQISEGIVWAADHGANVINLSLGGIGFAHDTTLADAISYAFNKDVVIVAAAGNDVAITGGNLDVEPVFPICNDNGKNMVIGVTATDVRDLKPDFANFGKACIDVSAPGRRIISTINHDPANGQLAPDSYAYASGTSLAVPFVSAQAALLKSMFPSASNRQIRDRIIATAEGIDKLNLSQCGGHSCKGLLGGGRINVYRSLQEQILGVQDGDLVKLADTDLIYYINGGKRQFVTPFVFDQRFKILRPREISQEDLDRFPEGSYAEPLDGTLVKSANELTVYYMEKGLRLPITSKVFQMRGFNNLEVKNLSPTEVHSWIEGSFLTPPDGTLMRGTNPTLYWVVGGLLHPVNYQFWNARGLNTFPIVNFSEGDISKFPKGDPYIL